MTKDLKEKAIQFKGKAYVQVKDRVDFFNTEYPNGCIKTELLSQPNDNVVVFKAIATPDAEIPERYFTGYSQARWDDTNSFVNKTSALENAETSAVGRALAFMGIGVIDSVASIDEVNKAINQEKTPFRPTTMTNKCEFCGAVSGHKPNCPNGVKK
jgi:hypothetical protein